ncbi:MAG: hypothetical protein HOV81_39325 [Kofleriaceae bacterium]|nr:hypothetical protein [Kofleriaceae bacterium]
MRAVLVAIACVIGTGCTGIFREAGKGLGTGMAQASQTEVKGAGQTEPGTLAEHTARDIITGSLDEAAQSERLAELQLVASAAASAALRGMANATGLENQSAIGLITDEVITGAIRGMSRGLEDRSFGRNLDTATQHFSSAMIRGVRSEMRDMFPECSRADARENCLETRIIAMSRAASAGLREALTGVISVPMLALAFLVGAIAAALVTIVVMHGRMRRMAE